MYLEMGFDDIMRRVSQIKPTKPKKNAKRKKIKNGAKVQITRFSDSLCEVHNPA